MLSGEPVTVTPWSDTRAGGYDSPPTFPRQWRKRRPRAGVHAVGQQDDVAFGGRGRSRGSAGEAGMAVRSDGEQLAAVAGVDPSRCPAQPGRIGWSGGLCGSVNLATVSGLKRRTPSSSPPLSIICAKRARSAAVENMPACPPRRPWPA